MLVMVLVIGAEMAYTAWIYSYATIRVGMRSEDAAYLNSSFWMAFTVGRMCMVLLAACFTPGALSSPAMSLCVSCVLACRQLAQGCGRRGVGAGGWAQGCDAGVERSAYQRVGMHTLPRTPSCARAPQACYSCQG